MCLKRVFIGTYIIGAVIIVNLKSISLLPAVRQIDANYYLVTEAHAVAEELFMQSHKKYDQLKVKSLNTIDTFLDLVKVVNDEMGKAFRSAVVKYYRINYFFDFTNYIIPMEELINITEHCLMDPVEKLDVIRDQFNHVVKNFEDVRNFKTVDKCREELPDEVAVAHCILHQAVLFNETMHESLVTIVRVKTRQYAQDMNATLFNVQNCLKGFVPNIFGLLLVDVFTDKCNFLKVVNSSISDIMKDKWRNNAPLFPNKWARLVKLLKDNKRCKTNLCILGRSTTTYFHSKGCCHAHTSSVFCECVRDINISSGGLRLRIDWEYEGKSTV